MLTPQRLEQYFIGREYFKEFILSEDEKFMTVFFNFHNDEASIVVKMPIIKIYYGIDKYSYRWQSRISRQNKDWSVGLVGFDKYFGNEKWIETVYKLLDSDNFLSLFETDVMVNNLTHHNNFHILTRLGNTNEYFIFDLDRNGILECPNLVFCTSKNIRLYFCCKYKTYFGYYLDPTSQEYKFIKTLNEVEAKGFIEQHSEFIKQQSETEFNEFNKNLEETLRYIKEFLS